MRFNLIATLFFLTACSMHSISGSKPESDPVNKLTQAAQINTQLALNYIAENNMILAKEKLLLALKQDPHSSNTHAVMAYYLERAHEFKAAEEYYKKAIILAEHKGAAENNYGTFLCRQNRYLESEAYFKKAVHDPTYINTAKSYENAGRCAEQSGEPKKAKDYYKKALEHDPLLLSAQIAMNRLEKEAHGK